MTEMEKGKIIHSKGKNIGIQYICQEKGNKIKKKYRNKQDGNKKGKSCKKLESGKGREIGNTCNF
jgi:hypothetical protein